MKKVQFELMDQSASGLVLDAGLKFRGNFAVSVSDAKLAEPEILFE